MTKKLFKMDDVRIGILCGSIQTMVGHPFDTLKTCIQVEKKLDIKILYNGCRPAFISSCIQNIFVFGIYHKFEKKNDSLFQTFYNGSIAGLFSSLFISPLEREKCKLQIHYDSKIKLKSSIWQGLQMTILRDTGGFGLYFMTYEIFKELHCSSFISGGCAGFVSWIYSYPIDVLKTRIQCDVKLNFHNLYKGFGIVALRSFFVNSLIFYVID